MYYIVFSNCRDDDGAPFDKCGFPQDEFIRDFSGYDRSMTLGMFTTICGGVGANRPDLRNFAVARVEFNADRVASSFCFLRWSSAGILLEPALRRDFGMAVVQSLF